MLRKSVLALLADKASDDGRGIWASKQTIADELDCSKRAVIETVKAFIDEGILKETGKHKVATGHTIEYAMMIDAVEALPLVESEKARQLRKANKGCATVTGEPDAPVNEVHGRGEPGAPKPSLNLSPSTSDDKSSSVETPTAIEPIHLLEAYNAMAGRTGLPMARKLDGARLRRARVLVRTATVDDLTEAIDAIERNPWMHGQNDKGWRADFDFLLQPKSFTRLIEGSYDRAQ